MKANPSRANELRAIEGGQEGWLKKVWPALSIFRVTLSGPYAACLPKVCCLRAVKTYFSHVAFLQLRHHFGPTVSLQSTIFSSTESMVGFGYDANDTNLYRLDSDEHIEFLDAEKGTSTENLLQPVRILPRGSLSKVLTNF